jgi:hypothetical protein
LGGGDGGGDAGWEEGECSTETAFLLHRADYYFLFLKRQRERDFVQTVWNS